MRRFEVIKVLEPNEEETINILYGVKKLYENHYNIKINKKVINNVVKMANKYIVNRYNPDKSLDLLDTACAKKVLNKENNFNLSKLEAKMSAIKIKKEKMIKENKFKEALAYRHQELNLMDKLSQYQSKPITLTIQDVTNTLTERLHIPNLTNKWPALNTYLNDRIIGQEEAIKLISKTLPLNEGPVSIMLTGSTGVGKTQTVKEIAKFLDIPLIKLDMIEYSTDISITRLLGASAGYVGYDEQCIFDKIKMNPCSIILLDEVEKSSPQVLNLFLQILDEGYITNAKGEKINFKNTYIFLTSNAKAFTNVGFMKNKTSYENNFSKEFLARIKLIVPFKNIDRQMINKYLHKLGINNNEIVNGFDYQNQGFRGFDRYLQTKLKKVTN